MMTASKEIDVTGVSELLRMAEEVHSTNQPLLLKRGDEELAIVMPVQAATQPTADNGLKRYTIIESDIGPLISESRSTVYDVMELYDAGHNIYEIGMTFNLTPLQVETAVEYIEQHRDVLERELKEILVQKAEYERYHRAIAAERQKLIDQLPMTPQRAAFYALREKNRRTAEMKSDADHSQ